MGENQAPVRSRNQLAKPVTKIPRAAIVHGVFCVAAFVLMALANNVLNTAVFPSVAAYAPYGREIAILFGAACFLGFYFLASHRPQWLAMRAFTICAVVCVCAGTVLLEVFVPTQSIVFTIIGLIFVRLGSVWASLLLALALVQLRSKLQMVLCVVWGMAVGEIVRAFILVNSPVWGVVIESCCYIGIGLLLYKMAAPVVSDLAQIEAPADVEVVNPESFLAPGNVVYLCVLVFNIALGFALTLNEGAFNPITLGITALVILLVAIWLSCGGSPDREDELFSFCVLITVAGFLVAPFTFLSGETTANTLLGIGARLFELLIWLAVLSVGRRNILALLPSFALLRAVSSLGTTIGAVAGHGSTALAGEGTAMAAFITDAALFVFIVILWLGFRNFSFSKVIQGVATLPDVIASMPATDDGLPGSAQEDVRVECEALESPQDSETYSAGSQEKGIDTDRLSHSLDEVTQTPSALLQTDAFESEGESAQQIDHINRRCEELGKRYHLTPREIEIFALLARGRNGSFIMNHFYVSRNTAKSHIKHIYTKLGVHSQQELIDMVEKQ